jgi:hypothetical protein
MQQLPGETGKVTEAKQVAFLRGSAPTVLTAALFPYPLAEWDPWYIPQEQAWLKNEEGNFLPDGWWKFADGHIAIPESLAPTFVKQFHEGTIQGKQPSRPLALLCPQILQHK